MNKIIALIGQRFMAFADTAPGVPEVPLNNIQQILDLVNKIVNWVFAFFFAAAIFFILWAAFDFLTAAGKEEKLASAKNRLIYAAIGIALALVARSIPLLVQTFIKP
ncbi:MAG: hypothetical protein WC519_01120 [Parcubacteria group bacterium]